MSNFVVEEMEACGADGVDFISIFDNPANPSEIYESCTIDEMRMKMAILKTGRTYWRRTKSGLKKYIDSKGKELKMGKKVLIVVDMQNDFIDGSLGTAEAQAIVGNVREKIKEYERNCDDVLFTADTHFDDYLTSREGLHLPVKHCIVGTDGYEIAPTLNENNHIVIAKRTFGFNNWSAYFLNKYESVELVGVCTDICVIANAMTIRATYPELDIVVDASCCAGTTPENHKAALTIMKSCQIDVIGE